MFLTRLRLSLRGALLACVFPLRMFGWDTSQLLASKFTPDATCTGCMLCKVLDSVFRALPNPVSQETVDHHPSFASWQANRLPVLQLMCFHSLLDVHRDRRRTAAETAVRPRVCTKQIVWPEPCCAALLPPCAYHSEAVRAMFQFWDIFAILSWIPCRLRPKNITGFFFGNVPRCHCQGSQATCRSLGSKRNTSWLALNGSPLIVSSSTSCSDVTHLGKRWSLQRNQ